MQPGSITSGSYFFRRLRYAGVQSLAKALYHRLWLARPVLCPAVLTATAARTGLEVGGPSRVFSAGNILPVYRHVQHLDNVNFSSQTAWEDGLRDGGDFRFDPAKPPGRQFLREATALSGLADASYDFVLSSHCLEHCANPLAALREWRRVTRDGGHLLLILPNPRHIFDHHRPITTLAHLRDDFLRQTGEDDLTHLPEILAQHDLALDPLAGSPEQFRARSLLNAQNRCLHHHVFDLTLMRAILAETGWDVLALEEVRPMHLIALAQKAAAA
jgi:SAM-dependent methyltransferase